MKVLVKLCVQESRQLAFFVFLLILLPTTPTPAFQENYNLAQGPSKVFEESIPIGIDKNLWRQRFPANNPITTAKVELGRLLYFDRRLSADGTVSCATCHDPANAFTDHYTVALGVSGRSGTRNAPTILNAMFSERLFWDGRVGSLEEQAKQPLTNEFEMGMGSYDAVVARLVAIPQYRRAFRLAFKNEGITIDTIAKAIATYERTQLSGNSSFDRFIGGNETAITDAQRRGWELFKGKAKCIDCHVQTPLSPFFTDFKFHNTGVAASDALFDDLTRGTQKISDANSSGGATLTLLAHSEGFSELGRFTFTLRQADIGAFKTPTLRDIELTSPYMHDGSLKTLIEVVRFYNRGGNPNSHLDERMRPLQLSDNEINDLVEFMRSLTSDDVPVPDHDPSKPRSGADTLAFDLSLRTPQEQESGVVAKLHLHQRYSRRVTAFSLAALTCHRSE
jgi:cytochrome c peroxidase